MASRGSLRWRWTKDRTQRRASIIWKEGRRTRIMALGTTDPIQAKALLAKWRQERGLHGAAVPRGGLDEARDGFLDAIAVGAPSKITREFHRDKLGSLIKGLGPDWTRWTPLAMGALIHEREWAPATTRKHLDMGKRFIKWCRAQGYPCPDFVGDLRAPRIRRTLPKILQPAEMRRLLRHAEDAEHRLELGVHLACRGLSKGDIRTLDWSEVNVSKRRIHRHRGREKTGEDLPIPIEGRLYALLAAVPRKDRTGRVCTAFSVNHRSGNEDRDLRSLCVAAGVPRSGWHRMRHGWATMLYAEGVDVPTIGRLLGHAQGSPQPLRYITVQWDALREAVKIGERALAGPTLPLPLPPKTRAAR